MNAKNLFFFILLSSFCIANKKNLWVAGNSQQYADSSQPVEILNAKRLDFKKIDAQTEVQVLIVDVYPPKGFKKVLLFINDATVTGENRSPLPEAHITD